MAVAGEVHGAFEQAVLIVIASLSADASGAAIVAEVRRKLNRDVHSGAVHATLQRLERKQLIASEMQQGRRFPGRRRRAYTITAEGRRALRRAKTALDRIWSDDR
ncbi:MAG TPA: PadR family transcriptional regulator [Thermoanaerobaculia bacterium]|nr:PadR family transcriptional regulator [Thermoanaerobaculia bacterium]